MMLRLNRDRIDTTRGMVAALALVAFVIVVVRTAWMSDDAYITLRTVDNFIHGYGLTWNIAERVQAFTHPLWMFVLSALYFVTHEAYYTTLILGLGASAAAVLLLVTKIARSWHTALLAVIGLTLSKAFIDYSTSGLENPLTYLLLVLFFLFFLRADRGPRFLLLLSLITALLLVNRLDAFLMVAPAFILAMIETRNQPGHSWGGTVGAVVIGFLPFLAWEAFSLVYYGFLTPNTYFAKLNSGIPQSALWQQGLTYLVQSTRIDPLTSVMILASCIVAVWSRSRKLIAIAAGIILYLIYTASIGGDFMSGRFLAAPALCSAVILAASEQLDTSRVTFALAAVFLVVGLVAPYAPVPGNRFMPCDDAHTKATGIGDERGCYYAGAGLLSPTRNAAIIPDRTPPSDAAVPPQILYSVGAPGYAAGQSRHIVDLNALADPLLARLAVPPGKPWRIGHFERLVPAGYLESLTSGENRICHPGLREYYDRLSAIVRGPLLSSERLRTIWDLNVGRYNGLLASYGNPGDLAEQLCNATDRTDVRFVGGPRLVGYTVPTFEHAAGSLLPVTLYWQADVPHDSPLVSFIHIRPSKEGQPANPNSDNGMWAQSDHPDPGGRKTTDYWGEQVYVDQFLLALPDDMPAGEYHFEIGWFDPQSGEQFEPVPDTVSPPLAILWRSILLPPLQVQ